MIWFSISIDTKKNLYKLFIIKIMRTLMQKPQKLQQQQKNDSQTHFKKKHCCIHCHKILLPGIFPEEITRCNKHGFIPIFAPLYYK